MLGQKVAVGPVTYVIANKQVKGQREWERGRDFMLMLRWTFLLYHHSYFPLLLFL